MAEFAVYRGFRIPRWAIHPTVKVDEKFRPISGICWRVGCNVDPDTGDKTDDKTELPPDVGLGDILDGTEVIIESLCDKVPV